MTGGAHEWSQCLSNHLRFAEVEPVRSVGEKRD